MGKQSLHLHLPPEFVPELIEKLIISTNKWKIQRKFKGNITYKICNSWNDNALERPNSRMEMTEARDHEFGRSIEMISSKQEREKNERNREGF